jgi:hypothetical protein
MKCKDNPSVIHETSDLAKKMYIQDGNLPVVQSISHIPDYEPSIRKTHNTMEGCGVLQKKMVGLKLRARSNLGKGGPRKILKCKEEYC